MLMFKSLIEVKNFLNPGSMGRDSNSNWRVVQDEKASTLLHLLSERCM